MVVDAALLLVLLHNSTINLEWGWLPRLRGQWESSRATERKEVFESSVNAVDPSKRPMLSSFVSLIENRGESSVEQSIGSTDHEGRIQAAFGAAVDAFIEAFRSFRSRGEDRGQLPKEGDLPFGGPVGCS
jgi:hypothetical protein